MTALRSSAPAGRDERNPAVAPRQRRTQAWPGSVRRWALQLATLVISLILAVAALGTLALAASMRGVGSIGSADHQLASREPSVVTVMPGNGPTGGSSPRPAPSAGLTLADIEAIVRAFPDVPLMSRVVSDGNMPVVTDAAPHAVVEGVDPSYAQASNGVLAGGAFFTQQDATPANRVAVLGQRAAINLFPDGQAPIGKTIRIRNQPYTVVGVLASQPGLVAADTDNTVFVPFQTGQVRLFGTQSAYELVLQVRDSAQASAVSDQVQLLLRQRHRAASGQPSDFSVRTQTLAARGAAQAALQTLASAFEAAHQFTCQAKGLCGTRQQS